MVTRKGAYVAARRVREVLNRDAFRQIVLYRPACQPHFLSEFSLKVSVALKARHVDTLNASSYLHRALHNLK